MAHAKPTPNLLDLLYRACKRNAAQLLAEAECLMAGQHFARAFALATTASEELSKAQLAADLSEGTISTTQFFDTFSNHVRKHAFLSRKVVWPRGKPEAATVLPDPVGGKALFRRRNQALFVDLVGEAVQEPSAVITRAEAQALIADTRELASIMNFASYVTGKRGAKAAAILSEARK
jgi:AbiV family abortive infection protein